jgi:hypothetical protein
MSSCSLDNWVIVVEGVSLVREMVERVGISGLILALMQSRLA